MAPLQLDNVVIRPTATVQDIVAEAEATDQLHSRVVIVGERIEEVESLANIEDVEPRMAFYSAGGIICRSAPK